MIDHLSLEPFSSKAAESAIRSGVRFRFSRLCDRCSQKLVLQRIHPLPLHIEEEVLKIVRDHYERCPAMDEMKPKEKE